MTQADKGGAILLLDFEDAVNCVKEELSDPRKFQLKKHSVPKKMMEVKTAVKDIVLDTRDRGLITNEDKTRIPGLNENDNYMHAPVLKPVTPYVYPLFKLHKLTAEQIERKVIPPLRLVHATREGPLYRMEKWVRPYLTTVL